MKPAVATLFLSIAIGTTVPAAAADGVLLAQRITSGTSVVTTEVQIEKTRMRTEIADPAGARQVVVFDAGKQVLYIISPERKSYMEMTKADLDRMAGMMQGMMAQMQAQMANLPPEQRAKMEAMMKGRGMPGGAAETTQYKRAGSDKAGKWTCDKYDGFRAGQKVSEICTVAPSTLGLVEADFAVARQMAEFFRAMMPQAGEQILSVGRADEAGFTGLPIKSSATIGGRTTVTELTAASRQTFPDSLFAVPAGFEKQAMPMGMGR